MGKILIQKSQENCKMPQKCPQATIKFPHILPDKLHIFDKHTRLRFFGFVFGDLTASLWVATPPVVTPPIATSSFFFFVLPKIFFIDLEMPIFYSLVSQRFSQQFSAFFLVFLRNSVIFFSAFFLSNFISQQIFESLFIKSLNIKKSLFLKIYKTFLIDKK